MDFAVTNTCFYKINRKDSVSKHYLYKTPRAGEYRTGFIEGADFDEKRGVYASLIQYNKDTHVSLCMTWTKLD